MFVCTFVDGAKIAKKVTVYVTDSVLNEMNLNFHLNVFSDNLLTCTCCHAEQSHNLHSIILTPKQLSRYHVLGRMVASDVNISTLVPLRHYSSLSSISQL